MRVRDSGALVRCALQTFAAAALLTGAWAGMARAAGPGSPASAPSNDGFASAQVITGAGGSVSGDNSGATGEPGEPLNGGNGPIKSVWYQWRAPNADTYTFDLCASGTFDTTMGVYAGTTVSGLTTIVTNDDSCDLYSRVTFAAASGVAYDISVDGYDGATGTFVLTWSLSPRPPANDNFASAVTVTGTGGSVGGTNTLATGETGEPVNAGPGPLRSVWYRWTAPLTSSVTFDTCTLPASGDFDTTLGVYTGGAVNALTRVSVNDDGCAVQSKTTFSALAGTIYSISVDGYGGVTGNFVLSWYLSVGNDDFATATALSGNGGSVSGTNVGASEEGGEPANQGSVSPLASVWFSWTPPNSGTATLDTCTLPSTDQYDTTLGIYQGAAVGALTQVGTSDDGCGAQSKVSVPVTGGQTYAISVDGHAGARGKFVLTWALPLPSISVSDASQLEGNSGTGTMSFTVSLSATSTQTVNVDVDTADGTATAPSDYTSTSGTLTFTSGQTTKTATVSVAGDIVSEPDETFFVDLSGATNATVADGRGQGTIVNDDSSADLSVVTTDTPDPVPVGSNLTYVVSVHNGGPSGATDLTLTDTPPPGPTFVSVIPSQGTCSGTMTITCALGSLGSGAQASVTVVVTPTWVGTVTNSASAVANEPDPNPGNDLSTEATTVAPNAEGCTIVGTAGADTLTGTAGDDVICGGGGRDSVAGGKGNDALRGGRGQDTLQGGPGDDTFDGGAGTDTVTFAEAKVGSGVTADLSGADPACAGAPCATSADLGHDTFVVDPDTGFSTAENLIGTEFDDALTGDGGANRLSGGGGADALTGGVGKDDLAGGSGDDTLTGLGGSDSLEGDGGSDELSGGTGADQLDGGAQVDSATYFTDPTGIVADMRAGVVTDGYGGSDTLTSMEQVQGSDVGADDLSGTSGVDAMYGNGGNDTLSGLAGDDTLDGGAGTDTIDGGLGVDTCRAGENVTKCERVEDHASRGSASSLPWSKPPSSGAFARLEVDAGSQPGSGRPRYH